MFLKSNSLVKMLLYTAISPVKTSKSNEQMQYFNAKLSGGKKRKCQHNITKKVITNLPHHLRILSTSFMRRQVSRKGLFTFAWYEDASWGRNVEKRKGDKEEKGGKGVE